MRQFEFVRPSITRSKCSCKLEACVSRYSVKFLSIPTIKILKKLRIPQKAEVN